MAQRRTRFTVKVKLGEGSVEKRVIRAYTAENAINYYTRRGYTVLSIAKGDYRKQEREAKAKAQGGHRLDHKAIQEAADVLGLKLPVRVRQHSRVGNTHGNYRLAGLAGQATHHNIMVKSYLTPKEATNTLWHELTHALQAERDGKSDLATWRKVSNEQKVYSYRQRPIEREANETAALMSKDHPLAY
jgi:hypothetical protein